LRLFEQLRQPDGQVVNVSVNGNLQTNNAVVLLTAALEGIGLILVPNWMACQYIESGELAVLLPDYQVGISDAQPSVYAVYPSSRFLSPKVRAFVDFCVAELADLVRTCTPCNEP
jgi:DNA-binding transcriptional LysR family regulator